MCEYVKVCVSVYVCMCVCERVCECVRVSARGGGQNVDDIKWSN